MWHRLRDRLLFKDDGGPELVGGVLDNRVRSKLATRSPLFVQWARNRPLGWVSAGCSAMILAVGARNDRSAQGSGDHFRTYQWRCFLIRSPTSESASMYTHQCMTFCMTNVRPCLHRHKHDVEMWLAPTLRDTVIDSSSNEGTTKIPSLTPGACLWKGWGWWWPLVGICVGGCREERLTKRRSCQL